MNHMVHGDILERLGEDSVKLTYTIIISLNDLAIYIHTYTRIAQKRLAVRRVRRRDEQRPFD